MARTARDPDAVRSYELRIDRVIGIVIVAVGIPFLDRFTLELGIIEDPETHNTTRATIDFGVNCRWFRLNGLVDPEPILIRLGRLFIARLVDQSHLLEPG